LLRDGQERISVRWQVSRLDQPELRIAVLNPLLRWPLGPKIGTFSLWNGIQWILLLVCAVCSDMIKEKLLKPIIARWFPMSKKATQQNLLFSATRQKQG